MKRPVRSKSHTISDEAKLHQRYACVEGKSPRLYPASEFNVYPEHVDVDATKVIERLSRHGFKAFLVGGGVRDLILGKAPKDFDVATDATPRQMKSLFRNCRIIGRRFKLAHVFFSQAKIIEVATFRGAEELQISEPAQDEDSSNSRAHDENVFGDECSDAFRRDLTINALFYDLEHDVIVDYVNGMEDFRQHTIRIIGEPHTRLMEDPVRAIRAVRHAVRAKFNIEEHTARAIKQDTNLLFECSPVRLYEEIKRDISSYYCTAFLQLCREHQLLDVFFPYLEKYLSNTEQFISFKNAMDHALLLLDPPLEPTLPLALIVIASRLAMEDIDGVFDASTIADCKPSFNSNEVELFQNFQIPKKEKERIQCLLSSFTSLLREKNIQRVLTSISRMNLNLELRALFSCIPNLPLSEDKLAEIQELLLTQKREKPERKRKSRTRSRNISRKPL